MKALPYILAVLTLAGGLMSLSLWTQLTNEQDKNQKLSDKLTAKETELASTTVFATKIYAELASTSEALKEIEEEKEDLEDDLDDEKDKNDEFEDQIKDITGTIGKLDKLSKMDPELLKKYSKVYFLNEHYMPPKLLEIDDQYLYSEAEPKFIHKEVAPFLEDLIDDANDDDIELWVVSAFRSFDEQQALKGQYTTWYGEGANTFSADQGYSEHQLGTTVDFTTSNLGGGLVGFGNTEAYEWLLKNAYKRGFVLSYPEDNEYYQFEPWHWRFVGTDLAKDLRREKSNFYDMDQREIDEYLIDLFE